MHTASDSTRRSGNKTRWFRTCAKLLLNAHQARGDLRDANFTLSVCLWHHTITDKGSEQTERDIRKRREKNEIETMVVSLAVHTERDTKVASGFYSEHVFQFSDIASEFAGRLF